jgi:hypothetical protein
MNNEEDNQTENKALHIGGVINRLQNLDRFEMEGGMGVNAGMAFPEKDNEGDWVRFEDIEKLLKELLQNVL